VRAKYAEAGCSDLHGAPAAPFLVLGLNSEENTSSGAQLTLFVRHEHPQCLIEIEGQSGATRSMYAARLPDGLDLLARWSPIVSAAALTAVVGGLMHPDQDSRGRPTAQGLVEAVVLRARSVHSQ
jgi:hypothetical protein